MVARRDRGTPGLESGCVEASTTGRNGYEHVHHSSTPSALPASVGSASLAEVPPSPAEISANEKEDQERMVEGDDKDLYPSIPTLVTLTIALMIAIFMIGLDTNIIGKSVHFTSIAATASYLKENTEPKTTTRDRHPKNHEPFPQLERRRLVWIRISTDPTIVAINFREIVFTLQHQMGLHRCASHF